MSHTQGVRVRRNVMAGTYGGLILYRRLLRQARPYWLHIVGVLLLDLLATPLVLLTPLPLDCGRHCAGISASTSISRLSGPRLRKALQLQAAGLGGHPASADCHRDPAPRTMWIHASHAGRRRIDP